MESPEVLVLGDMHGEGAVFVARMKKARERGVRHVLQLGDFGYWEHHQDGAGYLKLLSRQAGIYGMQIIWIDGNHENHDLLRARYVNDAHATDGGVNGTGLYEVRPNVIYASRGARWDYAGTRFLAMGGAASIDTKPVIGPNGRVVRGTERWKRVEGKSWWPTEVITDAEIDAAIAGGDTDVLVSHDSPWGVDIPTLRASDPVFGKDAFPESAENRRKLRRLVDAVKPALLLHGHYHDRYQEMLILDGGHPVEVHGFAHENFDGAAAYVDFGPYRAVA